MQKQRPDRQLQQLIMVKGRNLEIKISIIFFIISLSCFVIHFISYRHTFPPVNVDEASFFSPGYSFAKRGVLSSEIHKSFLPGSSRFTYWMPPLYLILLGTVFKVFGVAIFNAKALSFILSILSAFFFSFITKDKYLKFVAISLFLICPFVIITSAFIRVEALSILLIVLSIVAVKNELNVVVLGILAGLGLMTHPLLLPCAAAIALIVLRSGIKNFIIFSIVALITISPYLLYIFKNTEVFQAQMSLQFLRKSKVKLSDLKLSYLLQSVPFVFLALFCLYKVEGLFRFRLFITVAMLLSLVIVLRSNEFNYQVYIIPYVIASVILIMDEQREVKLVRFVLPVSLYLFLALILISKTRKYDLHNDDEYNEVITYLSNNKTWQGQQIYVDGNPDVATYFLQQDQNVERQIPIEGAKPNNWFDSYNYVVNVHGNNVEGNYENDSSSEKPWLKWQQQTFTTSGHAYTVNLFIKPQRVKWAGQE
ncbi:MAG: hypothetical protein JWR18_1472 [Segetibacter sp.]|nr:hypothetical protein [Segetibacter sp.]